MRQLHDHEINDFNRDRVRVSTPHHQGTPGVYTIMVDRRPDGTRPIDAVSLRFQRGDPAKGVNGISLEALLAVVLDQLRHFQRTPMSCRENALAITKLEEALHWLEHRARDRVLRGVADTQQK